MLPPMPALEDYLSRPMTAPDPQTLQAVEAGPIDPDAAQPADDLDLLLDSRELSGECGWCVLPDGCGSSWTDPDDDARFGSWPPERMREMEHLSFGIQLADENLAVRPARFVSEENLKRLDEIRERYDPDNRFHSWMGRPAV